MSSKVPLGEVAKFINGRAFKPSDWGFNGLPIIRIQNLTNEEAAFNYYNKAVEEQYYVKDGDLLISWSATLDVFIWNRGDAILNQHIFRAIPDTSKISKMFLFYALKYVMDDLRAQTHGATMKHITRKPFEQTRISLPPIQEQERIVRLLDEAQALRATRERANARMEQFVPALFQEMFGDPSTNPKKWDFVPVSSFVKEFQAGRSILTDGSVTENTKYWVLKVSAVTWGDYKPNESKPVPKDYQPLPNHFVKTGDLLFSRANTTELVGATVFVFDTPPNRLLSDKLWRFVWKNPDEIEPLFVWWLFQTPSVRDELGKRATGTGGSMKNISQPKVLSMPVPLPPLALQREFAARVGEARGVQSAQGKSAERVEALYQSMLSRAFAGEL